MNSLASILYSSSPAKTKKRPNLSLQPSIKPISTKASRCQVGMLFRSSTPKTPLQQSRAKTTIATAHPTTLSTSSSSSSSSMSLSIQSSQSPRCSTPVFAKQRRTRPFIVCELCRQRAFQSINSEENKIKHNHIKTKNDKQQSYHHHHHHHSATLQYHQHQTNNSSIRRRRDRRRSSLEQLLVWIL